MSWVPDTTVGFINWLRATVSAIWLACGFVVALAVLWLTVRASFRFVQWLDSTLFSSPW